MNGTEVVVLGKLPEITRSEDTYSKMPYNEFLDCVTRHGFKVAFNRQLIPNTKAKELIFYHKEKGLILYSAFSEEDKLILLNVSGEICYKEITDENLGLLFELLNSGHHFKAGDKWHWKFRMDGEEKIFSRIDKISENLEFCNPWSQNVNQNPNFISPIEEEQIKNRDDVEKIINKKIKAISANPNILKIIG